MNSITERIAAVTLSLMAFSACSEDITPGLEQTVSGTMSLRVEAALPDYLGEGTKGSLVNTVRISWADDDVVYVYDGTKCLGTLTASLDDALDEAGKDKYAILAGEISASAAPKLTLVALSNDIEPSVKTKDGSLTYGKVLFSIASQNRESAPYIAYATIDNPGAAVADIRTSFKLATSVIKVNCTGLKAGVPASKATISGVYTELALTTSATADPSVNASGDKGTITRTVGEGNLGTANAEGIMSFSVAVLAQDAAADRIIKVSQEGWPTTASFTAAALTKGLSYNTVCQLCGPYKTVGGHSGVRLWDGGPYFATCNLGAKNPYDYGNYYMWGYDLGYEYRDGKFYKPGTDTEIASGGFAWTNYTKFGTYNGKAPYYGLNKYDGLYSNELEPIDDAATIEWGSGWRLPSVDELGLLMSKATRTKSDELGGDLFTGKDDYSGISVFIPRAGYGNGTSIVNPGTDFIYWSKDIDEPTNASGFYSTETSAGLTAKERYIGCTIRPVID